MIKAILERKKTVTRRAIKLDLGLADTDRKDNSYLKIPDEYGDYHDAKDLCKYQVGDILYVRETWQDGSFLEEDNGNVVKYIYKADDTKDKNSYSAWGIKWRASLHMPKDAARIFLKVTDVKVEKLHDITEDGAEKEMSFELMQGLCAGFTGDYKTAFEILWDNIYKDKGYGWEKNPFVWVIEFEIIN